MNIPDEGCLTALQRDEIENLAEGLTESEVCLYMWGITPEQMDEALVPEFRRHYTRGRTKFKLHAIHALKAQMNGKQGLQASLAALTRFAEAWPQVNTENAGGTFSFNINMDADD